MEKSGKKPSDVSSSSDEPKLVLMQNVNYGDPTCMLQGFPSFVEEREGSPMVTVYVTPYGVRFEKHNCYDFWGYAYDNDIDGFECKSPDFYGGLRGKSLIHARDIVQALLILRVRPETLRARSGDIDVLEGLTCLTAYREPTHFGGWYLIGGGMRISYNPFGILRCLLKQNIAFEICLNRECTPGKRREYQFQSLEETIQLLKSIKWCAGCGTAPTETARFQRCSRCKSAFYCKRECQKSHWPRHKKICA